MDIISQFNLPKYIKGKSFAEASALIAKKFEGRTSPEDIATLNDLQGRLRDAQEFVKSEQEKKTKPQQAAQTFTSRGSDGGAEASASEPASNQYATGGLMSLLGKIGGTGGGEETAQAGMGKTLGGVTALADMAQTAFGKTGIDTSGATDAPDVPGVGIAAGAGALKGASAGMQFGPVGAAVGGVLGGVSGLIGGKKAKKDAEEAALNYDLAQHYKSTNTYKYGGELEYKYGGKMYDHGGLLDTDPKKPRYSTKKTADLINDSEDYLMRTKHYLDTGRHYQDTASSINPKGLADLSGLAVPGLKRTQLNKITGEPNPTTTSTLKPYELAKMSGAEISTPEIMKMADVSNLNNATKPKKDIKFNPSELLRYAPTAMNAFQLSQLKKPEREGLDRLNTKYEKQLVDEESLQNIAKGSVDNLREALLSSSGGSGSAARAALLASQLSGNKALSDAYMKASAENRQEGRAAQQFNLGVDQANISQSNQEKMINLQRDAAYQTNKSRLLAQLGQDLGGIGTEELLKRFPELMGLNYNWRGKYNKNS